MALPPYDDLRTAALRLIGDGRVHPIQDVIDEIARELGVGAADRALLTPKMHRRKFDIDVESAVADLRRAEWLKNTRHGRFRITVEGRAALSLDPKRVDRKFLRENSAAFREDARRRQRRREPAGREEGKGGRKMGAECDGIVAVIDAPAAADAAGGGGPLSLLRYARDLLGEEKALGGIWTAAFPGTLLAAAEGGGRRDLLHAFGRAVWPAVTHAIREGVQVSGCVASGRFSRPAENWVGGPAASEAAAHRGMPRWIGISAAPGAGGVLARAAGAPGRAGRAGGPYAVHGVPAGRRAGRDAWAVNWPGQCDEADGREIEELVGIMDDRIESAPDAGAALRWWNTRRFCEKVLAAP